MKNHLLFLFVLALLLPGCGPDVPDGFPKLYPVSIKVLQEGKPLDDAAVLLRIADGSMTWSVGGKTDTKGLAVLWTHGKYKGAPVGKFKVVLQKVFNEGEKEMNEAVDRGDYATANKIQVKSFSYVRDEYTSVATTPVEVDISRKSRVIEVDAGPAVRIQKEYMR